MRTGGFPRPSQLRFLVRHERRRPIHHGGTGYTGKYFCAAAGGLQPFATSSARVIELAHTDENWRVPPPLAITISGKARTPKTNSPRGHGIHGEIFLCRR